MLQTGTVPTQGSHAQCTNTTNHVQPEQPEQPEGQRFSTREASKFLGGHPTAGTLAVWRCTGERKIPYLTVGRLVFYFERDLVAFKKTYERYISTESKQNHE